MERREERGRRSKEIEDRKGERMKEKGEESRVKRVRRKA